MGVDRRQNGDSDKYRILEQPYRERMFSDGGGGEFSE